MTGQYSDLPWERVIWAIGAGLDPDPSDIEDGLASGVSVPERFLEWQEVQNTWGLLIHALRMNRELHPDDLQEAQASGIKPPDEIQQFIDKPDFKRGRGRILEWREHENEAYIVRIAACRLVDRLRSEPTVGMAITNRSRIGLGPAFQLVEPLSLHELKTACSEPVARLVGRFDNSTHRDRVSRCGTGATKRNFYESWWRPTNALIGDLRTRLREITDSGYEKREAFRVISKEGIYPEKPKMNVHMPVGLLWRIASRGKGLAPIKPK